MKLQTPVADEKCKVGISYTDRILMLGSCFSDSIGIQLKNFGFDVCVNPFGTLYNPLSILSALERLAGGEEFSEKDCVEIGAGDGRICTFYHHTSFARATRDDFLKNANERLAEARSFFLSCNKIIITLGTSWCFRHIEKDFVVSNCLKHPAAEFCRERLSESHTAEVLRRIAQLCCGEVPKQLIFTVSPIRHFKDGAHGNQLSKGSLLLGIDEVLSSDSAACPRMDYFPAYEIMMDELRDYRFYAEDMCHPSQQAVDYIRERFLAWALPQTERPRLEENMRSFLRSRHISSKDF